MFGLPIRETDLYRHLDSTELFKETERDYDLCVGHLQSLPHAVRRRYRAARTKVRRGRHNQGLHRGPDLFDSSCTQPDSRKQP